MKDLLVRLKPETFDDVIALVALYRHLGKYIKLGVGYNFSDFSDDLTQLDYHPLQRFRL